jgi:tripartite-type tricarboxylate transporter receptor subunit TctC
MLARLVQARMSAATGRTVIVENKGGAGGNIGAAYVAKSPADGYRILLATQPIVTINPFLYKDPGFDANKDLAPLTSGVNAVVSLVVHPSLPVNSVAELIEYGKKHPGELNYGTAGNGSPQHIGGLLFAERAGITMTHIPYRGGGPMVTDLLAGQIKVGIVTLSTVKQYIADKRLKVIAIGEKTRFSGTPDIPTIAETLPGFELTTWLGFLGPAGMPPNVVDYLVTQLTNALKSDEVKTPLLNAALLVNPEGPAALERVIKADQDTYSKIIKQYKITND